ncbi:Hsp20/alpha crystallin family protein [[Pseudomonas] boreopolis]|uniref:Hsp20/alpha crystallin family protein n=1 Tax=Xanthomonas boreopolis TaxID=86183 RepID=UPI003DA1C775
MSVSQLIPWNRNRGNSPQPLARDARDPFVSLHREMNRLFDELWRQADELLPRGENAGMPVAGWPSVDLVERDREIVVSAELPGLQEKDVEVLFENGQLVLRGERRGERDDPARRIGERWYGRFERRIPLDVEVEVDAARAEFRDGVLSVTLPKSGSALARPVRIPIERAA